MSISITNFKNWAAQNRNTAVAVNGGALESASNQIGVIDLIFRRGTVDGVRSAVMKEFTRALSARYGVTIAQQAISRAGLSEKSELTGKTISAVVDRAKALRADMLRPIGEKDIRLGDTTVARSQFKDLGPDDRKMLTKFLKQRAVAVELLGEFPLSMPDYQEFHIRANDLVARLRKMRDSIIPANIPADEFRAEVDALVRTIECKDVQMCDLLAGQRRHKGAGVAAHVGSRQSRRRGRDRKGDRPVPQQPQDAAGIRAVREALQGRLQEHRAVRRQHGEVSP